MTGKPARSHAAEWAFAEERRFLVGTSGFRHRAWRGRFYPPELSNGDMLTFYAERFKAVELYTTLQRTPAAAELAEWTNLVPERFRFAMQAPRQLVDSRHIDESIEAVAQWVGSLDPLGDRLGPVVLPMREHRPELHELQEQLARLPSLRSGAAIEPRDHSWTDDATLDAISARNVALCVIDSDDPSVSVPLVATADWGYVRLRREQYTSRQLQLWATRLADQPWRLAYVFFRHDVKGGAPELAARLARILAGADHSG